MSDIHSLCERIEDPNVSGFELFEDIETVMQNNAASRLTVSLSLLCSIAKRCRTDPPFQTELVDLAIIECIFKHLPECDRPTLFTRFMEGDGAGIRDIVRSGTKSNSDLQSIFGYYGSVDVCVAYLHKHLPALPSSVALLSKYMSCLVTLIHAHAGNKKILFKNRQFVENLFLLLMSPTTTLDSIVEPLVTLVCAILTTDAVGDVSSVFVRDACLGDEDKMTNFLSLGLLPQRSKYPLQVLQILSELCCSQRNCELMRDREWLDWVVALFCMQNQTREIGTACAKFFRNISFSDSIKRDVLTTMSHGDSQYTPLQVWIHQSCTNSTLCMHLFGTLANICLRNPDLARETVTVNSDAIVPLLEQTINSRASDGELLQCLHFLRILFKSNIDILSSLLVQVKSLHTETKNDKIKRICDEIVNIRVLGA